MGHNSILSPELVAMSSLSRPSFQCQPFVKSRKVELFHPFRLKQRPLYHNGSHNTSTSSYVLKQRGCSSSGFSIKWLFKVAANELYETDENEPQLTNTDLLGESIVTSVNGINRAKKVEATELQAFKWPLWMIGPSVFLVTGAIPMLWLPLPSTFSGSNIISFLTLAGLDGIFNVGATFFLLIADHCARSRKENVSSYNIPFNYKFWNIFLSVVGLLVPCLAVAASYRGLIQPDIGFLSFISILGPYMMQIIVQILAEGLTWHWKSPAWLIVPIVYEAYRFLQLIRGRSLGVEIGAPLWMIEGVKGLMAWWTFVFGLQLMRIAWFVGCGQTNNERDLNVL